MGTAQAMLAEGLSNRNLLLRKPLFKDAREAITYGLSLEIFTTATNHADAGKVDAYVY